MEEPLPPLTLTKIIEHYESLAEFAEIYINQDDTINAHECKLIVGQLMNRIVKEYRFITRAKLRLYGKLNRLEIKLSKYILESLRADYVEMESSDEEENE